MPSSTEKVKRVHVVFKTHLDVGFTNLACRIHQQYVHHHIPVSLKVAREMNTDGQKKFIWTMGSYMIDYALRYGTEEEKRDLTDAIKRGDIVWHGLAMTTHTELLDETLLDFDLSIAAGLDKRFGRHTIAAKMTDVPGHPQGLVRHLASHGIQYLHIGVNGTSMVPNVPPTFVWKCGPDKVIVQYSSYYGTPCYVEGQEDALEFAHTSDNMGPQSAQDVEKELSRIQEKYPGAEVFASTLDDYAATLLPIMDTLPVVDAEIGDTWDYGLAADPIKTAAYRELAHLKDEWLSDGRLRPEDPFYHDFMMDLLLVPEHTHGMDIKKFLGDYTHWDKEAFAAARQSGRVDKTDLPGELSVLRSAIEESSKEGSYPLFESSHEEQRTYLRAAVSVLPPQLQKEARARLTALTGDAIFSEKDAAASPLTSDAWLKLESFEQPRKAVLPSAPQGASPAATGTDIRLGAFSLRVASDGSLSYLQNLKDGHVWVDETCGSTFGRFGYASYDSADVNRAYAAYNRDLERTWMWAQGDFNKPGLSYAKTQRHASYPFAVESLTQDEGKRLVINLRSNEEASETYGCPRRAQIIYSVEEASPSCLKVLLKWFDKDANRMPEALWFDVKPVVENAPFYRYLTLGVPTDFLRVVNGGNRRQHLVNALSYDAPDGHFTLHSHHAPLLSAGGRWLFGDYRSYPDLTGGFSFCLYDNKWGTNFKMWCEDDAAFEFVWDFS